MGIRIAAGVGAAALLLALLVASLREPAPPVASPPEAPPAGAPAPATAEPVPPPRAAPAPPAAAPGADAAGELVPLEKLLTWPEAAEAAGGRGLPNPAPGGRESASSGAPGPAQGLRERLRVEHASEPVGPAGPKQDQVGRTQASVGVPLDDNVELRPGVRVDSRERGETGSKQLEPAPSVGVEVRF